MIGAQHFSLFSVEILNSYILGFQMYIFIHKFNENRHIIDLIHWVREYFPFHVIKCCVSYLSLWVQENGYNKSPNFQMHHLLEKKSEIRVYAASAAQTASGKYGCKGKDGSQEQDCMLCAFFQSMGSGVSPLRPALTLDSLFLGFARLCMWQILQRFKKKPSSSMKNGRDFACSPFSQWSLWVGTLSSKRYFGVLSWPSFLFGHEVTNIHWKLTILTIVLLNSWI